MHVQSRIQGMNVTHFMHCDVMLLTHLMHHYGITLFTHLGLMHIYPWLKASVRKHLIVQHRTMLSNKHSYLHCTQYQHEYYGACSQDWSENGCRSHFCDKLISFVLSRTKLFAANMDLLLITIIESDVHSVFKFPVD